MKLIPSDNLLKHLVEQNVKMPLGGFDIPDTAYADIDFELRRHPIHMGESEAEIKDRVDYAAIWRFHGVAQNNGAAGQELENVQKTASLTRQIVEMADTHLPNAADKVSAAIDDSANVIHAAVSELKAVTNFGHQEITQAVAGLKMFSAESHAEVLKVRGDLHADLMELLGKLHYLGKWLLGIIAAGFLFLAAIGIAGMILGIHARGQSTVIIGAQKGTTTSGAVTASDVDANHKALDVSIVAGGGTGGGPADTAPSATASESDVARQKVTSVLRLWDQTGLAGAQLVTLRGDLTNGAWVNCKSGCSSTSFADRSAFTFGTTSFGVMGGVFDDTPPAALTTGLAGAARVTANRALHINLRNAAGTEIGTSGTPIQVSIANTGANATAIKVDGSAVTQPISAASLPLPTGAAIASKQPAIGTAGTASADVISIQGIASMTPVKVDGSGVTQPVSGTVTTSPPANASTNIAQVGGTAVDTNSGNKSAGTQRVVIATDQPNLTTALNVNCTSGCTAGGSFADSSAFTFGTTAVGNISAVVDDVATNTVAENSAGAVRMNTNRILYVDLSKTAANATAVKVDNSAVTQPISAVSLPLPTGAALDSSLTTIDTDLKANVTLHAGANLIGKAGFDPTTPGTTNGVSMYSAALQTGNITTNATSIPVTTAGYSIATVTVHGTYAGVTYVFEFSDDAGTTYYPTTCTRTDTNAQVNGDGPLTNTNRAYDCSVYAASNFRVRSTAFTSGTAVVGITLSAAPIEAAPTVALATGSTTAVTQPTGTNLHVVVDTAPSTAVTGPLTDTQLRASAVPVSLASAPTTAVTNQGLTDLDAAIAAVGAAAPANAMATGGTDGTNLVRFYVDPCQRGAHTPQMISITASATLITGTAAKNVYICDLDIVSASADNIALVEGTGTVCATGIAGMAGGTTAATGWNLAANGGLVKGNGAASVFNTATAADNVCILVSGATQVSGSMHYVKF